MTNMTPPNNKGLPGQFERGGFVNGRGLSTRVARILQQQEQQWVSLVRVSITKQREVSM